MDPSIEVRIFVPELMREQQIDRILFDLRNYWHAHPNLRLGQLLINLTAGRVDLEDNDIYYVSDEVFEKAFRPAFTTHVEQVTYHHEYGSEAYRYRRLYEECARQLTNLYKYADKRGIDLPDPGPGFT